LPIIGHAVGPGGSWPSNDFLDNRKIDTAIVRSPTKPSKTKLSKPQLNAGTEILANVAIVMPVVPPNYDAFNCCNSNAADEQKLL
jgi:hypothetical protein